MSLKEPGNDNEDTVDLKDQSGDYEVFETAREVFPLQQSFFDSNEPSLLENQVTVSSSDTQHTNNASKASSEQFVLVSTTSNKKRFVESKAAESYRWVMSKFKKDSNNINDKISFERRNSLVYKKHSNLAIYSPAPSSASVHKGHNSTSRKISIAIPSDKQKGSLPVKLNLNDKKEQGSDNQSTINSTSAKLRKTSFWTLLKSPRIRSGNIDRPDFLDLSEKLPPKPANVNTSNQRENSVAPEKYLDYISENKESSLLQISPKRAGLEPDPNYFHSNHTFPKFPSIEGSDDPDQDARNKADFALIKPSQEKDNFYDCQRSSLKSNKNLHKLSQENNIYTLGLNQIKENMKKLNYEIKSKKATSSGSKNIYNPRIVPSKSEANLSHSLPANNQLFLLPGRNGSFTKNISHHKEVAADKSLAFKSATKFGCDADTDSDLNNDVMIGADIDINDNTSSSTFDELIEIEKNAITYSKYIFEYYTSSAPEPSPITIKPDDFVTFLGGRHSIQERTLEHYMDFFDFSGIRLDNSLRQLCKKLDMNGESQLIDRVLYAFARRFIKCNPKSILGSVDNAHLIVYSIFLLNTDLHKADIENKQRMTRSQYVENTIESLRGNKVEFSSKREDTLSLYSSFTEGKKKSARSGSFSLSKGTAANIKEPAPRSMVIPPQLPELNLTTSLSPNTKDFLFSPQPISKTNNEFPRRDNIGSKQLSASIKYSSDRFSYQPSTAIVFNTRGIKRSSIKSSKLLKGAGIKTDQEDQSSKYHGLYHIKNLPLAATELNSSFYSDSNSGYNSLKGGDQTYPVYKPNIEQPTFDSEVYTSNTKQQPKHSLSYKLSKSERKKPPFSPNLAGPELLSSFSQLSLVPDGFFEIDKKQIHGFLNEVYTSIKMRPLEKPLQPKTQKKSQREYSLDRASNFSAASPMALRASSTANQNFYFKFPENLSTGTSKNEKSSTASGEPSQKIQGEEKVYNISILSKSFKSDIYNTQTFPKINNRSSVDTRENFKPVNLSNDASFRNDTYFKNLENTEDHYLQPNQPPAQPSNSETFSSRSSLGPQDTNIPIASKSYYRLGMLNKKLLYEKMGKKSFNRSWRACYVSVGAGKVTMYKGDDKLAPLPGVFSNIPSTSQHLSTIHLSHTYTQVMPVPGYSDSRPFVVALTLSQGSVYLFQVSSSDEAQQWAFTLNYWAALTSKVPYIAGGVNNVDYGWNNDIDFIKYADSFNSGPRDGGSLNQDLKSNVGSSIKYKAKSNTTTSLREYSRNVIIADWAPTPDPSHFSNASEKNQVVVFEKHLAYLESELMKHKLCLTTVPERFPPRSSVYTKAFRNWERKAQYLLKELIKYKSYIDCLEKALSDFEKQSKLSSKGSAFETKSTNSEVTKSQKSENIHNNNSKEAANSSFTNFPNISLPTNF